MLNMLVLASTKPVQTHNLLEPLSNQSVVILIAFRNGYELSLTYMPIKLESAHMFSL